MSSEFESQSQSFLQGEKHGRKTSEASELPIGLIEMGTWRKSMIELLEEHDRLEQRCAHLEAQLQHFQQLQPNQIAYQNSPQGQTQWSSQVSQQANSAPQTPQSPTGVCLVAPLSSARRSEGFAGTGISQQPTEWGERIAKIATNDSGYLSERAKNRVSLQQLEEANLRLRSCFKNPPHVGDYGRSSLAPRSRRMHSQSAVMMHELELAGQSFTCQALDPNSLPRLLLDILLFIICVHDTAYVPYNLAWSVQPSKYSRVAEAISLCLWICDITMNFFTGYLKDGIIIRDLRRISLRYLTTSFPFDFMITSIDLIAVCMDNLVQDETLSKSGKVLRVLKLNKLARATIIFQRSAAKIKFTSNSWTLLGLGGRLVAIVLCLNHLICCMWFWLGDVMGEEPWTDTGSSWLAMKMASADYYYKDTDAGFQYLTSLHWALTQMTPGSMEVTPQNSFERVWNILCLVMGLFISSLLISQLSAKMVRVQTLNHEKLTQMELLRRFLLEQAVPRSLAARIQRQVQERASISKPLTFSEMPPLAQLPTTLRHELAEAVFAPWFLRHTIFFSWCTWDDALVLTLATRVAELEAFSPDDEVFSSTQEAKKIIVIQSGTGHYEMRVRLTEMNEQASKGSQDPGDMPPLVAGQFLSCIALWCQWTYVGSLSAAKSAMEVVSLHVDPLIEILRRKPEILDQSHKFAHAYSLLASTPENYYCLDLEITPPRVLMAMTLGERHAFSKVMLEALESFGEVSEVSRFAPLRSRVTAAQMELMQEELESGKCVVTLGNDGQLLRTVLLCVLKIKRTTGEMLVLLATCRNGEMKIEPKLPGSKLRDGESSERASKRVMQNELPDLNGSLEVLSSSSEEQIKRSSQHGLRTSYLKTTFKLFLQENTDDNVHMTPNPSSEAPSNIAPRNTEAIRERLLKMNSAMSKNIPPFETLEKPLGNGNYQLFAWLQPQDFAAICASSMENELKTWAKEYESHREVPNSEAPAPTPAATEQKQKQKGGAVSVAANPDVVTLMPDDGLIVLSEQIQVDAEGAVDVVGTPDRNKTAVV